MNLLDFLFPKRCVGCRKIGSYFCSECIKNINQTELVCPVCERASIGGLTHPLCRKKYSLDGLWSLGIYKPPLKNAIQKLKYKWIKEVGNILVDINLEYWARFQPLLIEKIKKDRGKNWIIVSVPLHKSRQNWRGFNQSELIAQLIAEKLGLEYKELLKRIRNTKPQIKLNSYERKQNIKGAFKLIDNCELKIVNCILIDDVWTTGSTLKECAYVLKRGGAKTVWALTIAR